MPDGRADIEIDFYASAFCREVLDAAHPTRFSKERITYGSDIFDGFRGHVWPANTNDDIAEDTRLVGTRRLPLAKLDEGSRTYGRIIHNMLRPFGRRQWKDHFLTTYADDRPVAFTIFDFDRHPPKGRSDPLSAESDEWLAIDETFWEKVSAFRGLATRFDLDVMWVQSPGRWLVDGHHLPCRMFGLYAVIRHEPRPPSELRPMLEALKQRVGLMVEASWDTRNRNIRIPGQCFMDVCRVDPARRTVVPVRDPDARTEREMNAARLAVTVESYGMLRPESGDRLLEAGGGMGPLGVHREGRPPEAAGELVTSPIGEGESPAAGSTDVGQGLTTSPSRKTAAKKRSSTSARKHHAASDNADPGRWLREPDTFRTLHESGLLRSALREHGWGAGMVGEAVRWMAPRFRRLRPASSATCSNPETLVAFLRKHYLWGCRTCDPAKAKADARRRTRAEDEARIAPSLRLDDGALEAYLTQVAGLSKSEMACLRRFRKLERAYAGRIAYGTLYGAFGSQRRFAAFRRRRGILRVAEEHSQSQGRCRQWTLSPRAVRSVRMLMASPALLFMLRGEACRVIYIQAPRASVRRRRRRGSRAGRIRDVRMLHAPAGAVQARGPPLGTRKTGDNPMPRTFGRASGARRRNEDAVTARVDRCSRSATAASKRGPDRISRRRR